MIINGGSRAGWRFFAGHLMNAAQNEYTRVVEIRGLASENVLGALREMDALAKGTRCKNFFYHANLNPREDERLTSVQWEEAIDRLESNLGLVGHSRVIVEHEKAGRVHRHVLWSRIDVSTMTAVSDSHNYACHERTAREIEQALELAPGPVGAHERTGHRPERRPDNWEIFRGKESGIDPMDVKAQVTALWRSTDNGQTFAAALEEQGYILAKGDKRDFVIVDAAGDVHSLARRIDGTKVKDVRARMVDVDQNALPSIDEARARAEERALRSEPDRPPVDPSPIRESPSSDFARAATVARPEPAALDLEAAVPPLQPAFAQAAVRPDYAASMKALMREHEGQPPLPLEGSRWAAAIKAAQVTVSDEAPAPAVVSHLQQTMRDNQGELREPGHQGFWERNAARVSGWVRNTLTEARDVFTAWIERYGNRAASSDRDFER